MAEQKPIKLEGGMLKQFGRTDELPNQSEVDETRQLLRLLLYRLMEQGFKIRDKELLNEISKL